MKSGKVSHFSEKYSVSPLCQRVSPFETLHVLYLLGLCQRVTLFQKNLKYESFFCDALEKYLQCNATLWPRSENAFQFFLHRVAVIFPSACNFFHFSASYFGNIAYICSVLRNKTFWNNEALCSTCYRKREKLPMNCKDGVSVRAYSVGWLLLLSSR